MVLSGPERRADHSRPLDVVQKLLMAESFFQQKIHPLRNRRFLQLTEHGYQMPTLQNISLQSQINI